MKRFLVVPSVFAVAVMAFGLVTSTAVMAQDSMKGAVQADKARLDIMHDIGKSMKQFKKAATTGKVGAAEAATAAELQGEVKKFLTLFPKGSSSAEIKTRAKPAIWAQWSKFEAHANDLIAKLGVVEAAAKAGDAKAFGMAFKETGEVCGSCHKPFRGPKP